MGARGSLLPWNKIYVFKYFEVQGLDPFEKNLKKDSISWNKKKSNPVSILLMSLDEHYNSWLGRIPFKIVFNSA